MQIICQIKNINVCFSASSWKLLLADLIDKYCCKTDVASGGILIESLLKIALLWRRNICMCCCTGDPGGCKTNCALNAKDAQTCAIQISFKFGLKNYWILFVGVFNRKYSAKFLKSNNTLYLVIANLARQTQEWNPEEFPGIQGILSNSQNSLIFCCKTVQN